MYDRSKFSFLVLTAFVFLFAIVCLGVTSSYSITEDEIGKWNVEFTDSTVINNGASLYDDGTVTDRSTTLSNVNFEFDNIEDEITYKIDVVNSGDIDGEIASIVITDPSCSNSDFCNTLEYTLTYEDGTTVKRGDKLASNQGTSMYLHIKSNATYMETPVTIEGINLAVSYTESVSE